MKIGVLVAVTSKNAGYKHPRDFFVLTRLIPSLLKTTTFDQGTEYKLYVGYDTGDSFFEKHHGELVHQATALLEAKKGVVEFHLEKVENISKSNPCFVWNEMFRRAYDDGCDYFLQTGDDVILGKGGWDRVFIQTLKSHKDIGITGGFSLNSAIITQVFLSRKHMDIFGYLYPKVFKNWYSDDWINQVYMPSHRYWQKDIRIFNTFMTLPQNPDKLRYDIDYKAKDAAIREIKVGQMRLRKYLKKK